jgi:hypothetical protein
MEVGVVVVCVFVCSTKKPGRVWHTRIVHPYGSASFMLEGGKTEYNSLGTFVDALKAKASKEDGEKRDFRCFVYVLFRAL